MNTPKLPSRGGAFPAMHPANIPAGLRGTAEQQKATTARDKARAKRILKASGVKRPAQMVADRFGSHSLPTVADIAKRRKTSKEL